MSSTLWACVPIVVSSCEPFFKVFVRNMMGGRTALAGAADADVDELRAWVHE
jgi:hypothetical protein